MIKSFRHKGIQRFFETGSKAGIQPKHAARLRTQLTALELAKSPEKLNFAGWEWHPLQGELAGLWAIKVNGNWRLTFGFRARMRCLSITRITTEEKL